MGLYRVRIVRGGSVINVTRWFVPTIALNNVAYSAIATQYNSNRYLPDGNMMTNIVNSLNSQMPFVLNKVPASVLLFGANGYANNSIYTDSYAPVGITNIIELSPTLNGDKYVFDNGNYIEITNATNTSLTVNYCLADGRIVYNGVSISSDAPTAYMYLEALPWHMGNPNDFRLFKFDLSAVRGEYTIYGSVTKQYYQPTSNDLALQFFSGMKPLDPDDPYMDINDAEPSGNPNPSGLPANSNVNIPSLPTVSVADTGFVTLFNPTLSEVKSLASYMWGSFFDISTFKKIFADPMDCILGFNLLPVSIPNGGTENVIVGNISTGVSMTKAGSQWVEVDCGTINIGTPYDNYLDYSPYTKYSIYLPYIGTVDLSADDCVGKDIHLVYHVDVLSCSCVAYLKCGDSVLYQFTGSCGYSIPLTSENFRSMISSIVSIAGSIAGVVASGGASAPLTIGAVANTANNVMGLKPDVHRSGAIGSSAGLMGIQTPYLILQFPNPCKPSQQYKYMGYPSFVTVTVGDLSGYTEFDSIILDEVTCDEDEKQLIEDVLKGGVFL